MTLRSRKAKFPGLETQKTDLFDPYSHHYVSRTLGNEYQLINTLPEAKHSGRGIRLWGYSSVTWTGRLVRIKCACSKIYVNLKWIPVSQYSGFKNSKKVILHQHNLKNTAVETQERISANSWMLTQLNTTVSEYLNQTKTEHLWRDLLIPVHWHAPSKLVVSRALLKIPFPPSALRFCPLHLQPLLSTSCLRQSSSVTGTNTAHQHSALLPPDRLNFLYSLYSAVPSSPLPPPPFPCSICPRLMPSLNISPATLPPSLKNKPKFSCNHASHCLSASWLISLGEWARTIVLCNTPNFGISPILAGSGNYAPGWNKASILSRQYGPIQIPALVLIPSIFAY